MTINSVSLELAKPSVLVRLDLACGQIPLDGYEGVDLLAPKARYKVDLMKFPWPWEDNSVDELHSSHFIEHIPARDIETRDLDPKCLPHQFVGQDMLFAFFDEAWRILKPDGKFKVVVPALQSARAFQDPTHRRFIPAELFLYLSREWRIANKLDHYRVVCDFSGMTSHSCFSELTLLHPEAAARRFKESWNTILDFHVSLVCKKS